MRDITTVIFDWAGTTVDYGCFAPVQAFVEVFREFGMEPTMEETRKPMGMLKIDHIRTMLSMDRIGKQFQEKHGRSFTEDDVKAIQIGSTTGYTDKMMEIVTNGAREKGYEPDCVVSPDDVCGKGRPYPYMIYENMKRLNVMSVHQVMKVGDTISDIKEGKNAGVYTVGVIEGSSEMGLSMEEFQKLSEAKKLEKKSLENKTKGFFFLQ
mgnify:CR=1 FL=1